jgi:4-diphosphocytidyl-2-C-methyl-D-erythritol kinase
MILFPNSKINLGLRVLEKRADGYHNIETVFYPIGWCDALEAMENKGTGGISLNVSGIPLADISGADNLCVKLYRLLQKEYNLPSVQVWLHKAIPVGAGLGGGSSDAAHFIKMLNALFKLGLTHGKMKEHVSKVGSDCAFFIDNKPAIAEGRGDVLEPINLDLSDWHIAVVYPRLAISTAEAYSLVKPGKNSAPLKDIVLNGNVGSWKNNLINDFEEPVIKKYPAIGAIREKLYANGAAYASLTGSGSAVYGIFRHEPDTETLFREYKTWKGKLTLPL